MPSHLLFETTDQKGLPFKITGDLQGFAAWASAFINVDPDDIDYGLNHINNHLDDYTRDNTPITQTEREKEVQRLNALASGDVNWEQFYEQIPKKKNGTFAKGRVVQLWRGETFEHYWEDSYGYNGPEVRLKTLSDEEAVLEFGDWVRKI